MATRINISIPEDLHARIQNFKEMINVSKVCQEALERAVSRLETRKPLENYEKLAERIVQEKMIIFKTWFERGFDAGLKNAQTTYSYDDFMQVVNKDKLPAEDDYLITAESVDLIISEPVNKFDHEAFVKGYKCGVLKIWGEIKDKVEQELNAGIQALDFYRSYKFLEEGTREWVEMWEDVSNQLKSHFPDKWEDVSNHLQYRGCGGVGYHNFRLMEHTTEAGEEILGMNFEVPDRRLNKLKND